MIFKGFRFGMLLQLAIGPVCLFIFQMGSIKGFYIAETGVIGVAVIDGLYIFTAIIGIASFIDKKNVKLALKISGIIILCVFGISTILSQFNVAFLPSLSLQNSSNSNIAFLRAILITISNPLTIIFWAGVFSESITEDRMQKKDMFIFGFGSLLSTIFFLTLIALIGSFTKMLISLYIIRILNLAVGGLLVYFGIRMIFKKHKSHLALTNSNNI